MRLERETTRRGTPRRLDMGGRRFGAWECIAYAFTKDSSAYWHCRCVCGTVRAICAGSLRRGHSNSCGCLRVPSGLTHGMSDTPTHVSWHSMLQRCNYEKHKSFPEYGGRGIRVCDRWLTFENFLADMGPRPSGKSIDRYPDNNGNYEPGNCRWATPEEQRANQRPRRKVVLSHCANGHQFTPANTIRFASERSARCLICRRVKHAGRK